ncbi:hypothetical protein SAMN05216191_10979, partial [Paenibacillus jilunlii]
GRNAFVEAPRVGLLGNNGRNAVVEAPKAALFYWCMLAGQKSFDIPYIRFYGIENRLEYPIPLPVNALSSRLSFHPPSLKPDFVFCLSSLRYDSR